MAKIILPLQSAVVKGKLADIVFFRRGDYGVNVARIRVIPQNPRTENQLAVRHNLGTLSDMWQTGNVAERTLKQYSGGTWGTITIASTETFTSTDKAAWADYVVIGTSGARIKGRLAFISVNLKRLKQGLNPLKTPTTEFELAT